MQKEEAQQAIEKYGSVAKASKAMGVGWHTLARALGKEEGGRCGRVHAPFTTPDADLSVAAVLASHDLVGRAVAIVGDIPAGKLRPDEQVRRELGVGHDRWKIVRGSARLSGHWLLLPDRTCVWGRKATIADVAERMKELL